MVLPLLTKRSGAPTIIVTGSKTSVNHQNKTIPFLVPLLIILEINFRESLKTLLDIKWPVFTAL